MAFVEPYEQHYQYVPFKHNWYVDVRPKKHLLKNGVPDKTVLEKMPTVELMKIVNVRNIDIIEKIINKRIKLQNAIANHTTVEDMDAKADREAEQLKQAARKKSIQLLDGLACATNYSALYGRY